MNLGFTSSLKSVQRAGANAELERNLHKAVLIFFSDICGIFKSEYYVQLFFLEKQSFDSL